MQIRMAKDSLADSLGRAYLPHHVYNVEDSLGNELIAIGSATREYTDVEHTANVLKKFDCSVAIPAAAPKELVNALKASGVKFQNRK